MRDSRCGNLSTVGEKYKKYIKLPNVLIGNVVLITNGIINAEKSFMSFNNFTKNTVLLVQIVQIITKCDEKL